MSCSVPVLKDGRLVEQICPRTRATIYAQWGNVTQALASLETALRQRDSDLEDLKIDPLLDPLRNEPRFQAIERELRFPDRALTNAKIASNAPPCARLSSIYGSRCRGV